MIKLGMSLPQLHWYDLRTDVAAVARGYEEIGLDSAWAFERLLVPEDQSGAHGLFQMPDVPWPDYYRDAPEPLTVLTTAGAVTSRIELGTNVLVAPLHLPVRLAKTLASVDEIIGGRLIAGLGTGWSIDEYQATAPRPFAERGAALDEFLDVAEAVWGPDPVKFHNERYEITPATVGPKPARRIPVVLGGGRGRALDRIARRADGWLPTNLTPAQIGTQLAQLRQTAADHGRDPGEIGCITQVIKRDFERVTTAGRAAYAGDFEQLTEDVAALAEAGVDHVFLASSSAARDRAELLDWAAAFHSAVRAAGL
ncbi:TIGR03619 family F420-dependent LLM class oxidoreductase [Kineosporia rhizophila]|uniref:TIGR03619 family F420-dependent LLM class oxidoreductase n=1 Tax=Kineosporia rhizophila TaxID=84633 RepID=UPI001E628631|nr:TIGR03619 family F420-dependent LLM class oxidoreductase [Kineosporia rhizophila]